MSNTVLGVFDDYGVASKVVDDLKVLDVPENQISVMSSEQVPDEVVFSQASTINTVLHLELCELIGSIVGGLTALILALHYYSYLPLLIVILAIFSGAGAGAYIGFLIGVIAFSELDVQEDDVRFYEKDIIVRVDTSGDEELYQVEKVMHDLGAIHLMINPLIHDKPNNNTGHKAAAVILSLIMSSLMFASSAKAQSFTPNSVSLEAKSAIARNSDGSKHVFGSKQIGAEYPVSPAQRVILSTLFFLLLLSCMIFGYIGLQSKGARKWLNFDVKPVKPNTAK